MAMIDQAGSRRVGRSGKRRRLARLAVVAGLLLSVVVSGTALGAQRSTSKLDIFGSVGVFGTRTDFFATWQVNQFHGEGKTVYLVEKLDMDAVVKNGTACVPLICPAWAYTASAKFYTAAGAQVGSFNLPSDNCYSVALNPANRNFSRCRRTGYEVPLTTTQVKFTWTVSVEVGGIWLPIWTTTKQVSLT